MAELTGKDDVIRSEELDLLSSSHGKKHLDKEKRVCEAEGCSRFGMNGGTFCRHHGGRRRCTEDGCTRQAQAPTEKCKKHGGGYRCQYEPVCGNAASGNMFRCTGHKGEFPRNCKIARFEGTSKQCQSFGCTKNSVFMTSLCKKHGGGKRCPVSMCERVVPAGKDKLLCVFHEKELRCEFHGCKEVKTSMSSLYCAKHTGDGQIPHLVIQTQLLASAMKQLTDLKAEVASVQQVIQKEQARVDTMKSKITDLETCVSALTSQISQVSDNNSNSTSNKGNNYSAPPSLGGNESNNSSKRARYR